MSWAGVRCFRFRRRSSSAERYKSTRTGNAHGRVVNGNRTSTAKTTHLVAVPPSGVGMRGPDGVPMPGLAVHPPPRMPVDGVVSDECHRPRGHKAVHQKAGQRAAQFDAGPPGGGQHAPVAGGVTGGEEFKRAEDVGHRPTSRRQQDAGEQSDEAMERGLGEQWGERAEQRGGFGW